MGNVFFDEVIGFLCCVCSKNYKQINNPDSLHNNPDSYITLDLFFSGLYTFCLPCGVTNSLIKKTIIMKNNVILAKDLVL